MPSMPIAPRRAVFYRDPPCVYPALDRLLRRRQQVLVPHPRGPGQPRILRIRLIVVAQRQPRPLGRNLCWPVHNHRVMLEAILSILSNVCEADHTHCDPAKKYHGGLAQRSIGCHALAS